MTRKQNETFGASKLIPYSAHITDEIVKLKGGSYLMCFRLKGTNYIGRGQEEIDARVLQISRLIGQMHAPYRYNLQIQSHCVRSDGVAALPEDFEAKSFAGVINQEYKNKVIFNDNVPIIDTEYYISVIYVPYKRFAGFSPFKTTKKEIAELAQKAEEELLKVKGKILEYFSEYDIETLGCYKNDEGVVFSEVLRFLNYLVNLSNTPVAIQRAQICDYLPTATITMGSSEIIRIDNAGRTQYAAIMTFAEYPEMTAAGMLQEFFELPWRMTITQSFAPIDKAEAKSWLDREYNRMASSDDGSRAALDELEWAGEGVRADRFVLGKFYWSVMIIDDSVESLKKKISEADAVLSGCGFKASVNKVAKLYSYYAQLPGNTNLQPREAKLSSQNTAQMMPFLKQNHGKASGNAWGPAVSMLRTINEEVYYFNFHDPEKGTDSTGKDIPGITFITGSTGTGKTVLLSFLLSQTQRYKVKPRIVMFDKDMGSAVFIRAMGGHYSQVTLGTPTGWNPFLLPNTDETRAFLKQLILAILEEDGLPVSPRDKNEIDAAIRRTLDLPPEIASIEAFANYMPGGNDSIRERLHAWTQGEYRWIFNNPTDHFESGARIIGIDYTQFLDIQQIRTPILMYLFHRIQMLMDGTPIIISLDEAWKPLRDPKFLAYIDDKQRTIRKEKGIMVFASQSPSDTYKGLPDSFMEQIATHIFLPNPGAKREVYVNKFGLENDEFLRIKNMNKHSRQFLVHHQGETAHCKLDMRGIDYVNIMSGSKYRAEIADEMMEQYGNDWISAYCERVKDPNFKLEEKAARLKDGEPESEPEDDEQNNEEELAEAV